MGYLFLCLQLEYFQQIVWYNDKNLYIFSPTKISKVVNRELKSQLVTNQVRNHEKEDEQIPTIKTTKDYTAE